MLVTLPFPTVSAGTIFSYEQPVGKSLLVKFISCMVHFLAFALKSQFSNVSLTSTIRAAVYPRMPYNTSCPSKLNTFPAARYDSLRACAFACRPREKRRDSYGLPFPPRNNEGRSSTKHCLSFFSCTDMSTSALSLCSRPCFFESCSTHHWAGWTLTSSRGYPCRSSPSHASQAL